MPAIIENTQDTKIQKMLDVWFEDIINNLRTDQQEFQLGTVSQEKEKFYKSFVMQSKEDIMNQYKKFANMTFVEQALKLYTDKLNEYGKKPVKLALNLSDSKLYIFAVIKNNDEATEDALLLSEAFVNNEYGKYGVHLSTTILEEDDNYPIPKHYKSYIG